MAADALAPYVARTSGAMILTRPSYLHNGMSYTGKTTSLYWIRTQSYRMPPNLSIPVQVQSNKMVQSNGIVQQKSIRVPSCERSIPSQVILGTVSGEVATWTLWFNILRPRQNSRHFADDTLFLSVQLTIFQHDSGNSLAPTRRQAIIWTNGG